MINTSISNLFLTNVLNGGNLLSNKGRLDVKKSHLHRFAVPFCLVPQELYIQHSSFNKFLDQVIKQSKNQNSVFYLACNSFSHIITDKIGSIFAVNQSSNCKVDRCSFNNVITTQKAACFYAYQTKTMVTKCSFTDCYADSDGNETTGNEKYGNAFYCQECGNKIYFSYTYHCGPQNSQSGDSAIALVKSNELSIKYINSSECLGSNGAASITFRESSCDNINITYINVINPSDFCAIEFSGTNTTFILYGNFINTTKCKNHCINHPGAHAIYLTQCYFINPRKKFSSVISNLHFEECFSNDIEILPNCTQLDDHSTYEIDVPFFTAPICTAINISSMKKYKMIMNSILICIVTSAKQK